MIVPRRWPWLIAIPSALVIGVLITRFLFIERSIRSAVGDEVSGPLAISKIEIDSWNRVRAITHEDDAITDSTFRSLRNFHRFKRSRTTLLTARGDSVFVLASGSRDTTRLLRQNFAFKDAPPDVRGALTANRKTAGAGEGLAYEHALYESVPIQGTDWILLREVDGNAVVETLLLPIVIDVAFVASLLLFAVAYLRAQLMFFLIIIL